MNKFKVGDKVIIIKDCQCGASNCRLKKGLTGTIAQNSLYPPGYIEDYTVHINELHQQYEFVKEEIITFNTELGKALYL